MKDRIGRYLFGPLREDGSTLFPDRQYRTVGREILRTYILGWAAAGFIGVLFGSWLTAWTGTNYFYEAGKEVAAIKVWNMVVMLGLSVIISASLAELLGSNKISMFLFSRAYILMKFASECGGLAIGVTIGLFFIAIFNSGYTNIVHYISTGFGIIAITFILLANCVIWWATYCLKDGVNRPEFLIYVSSKKPLLISLCLLLSLAMYISLATIQDYPEAEKCAQLSEFPNVYIHN